MNPRGNPMSYDTAGILETLLKWFGIALGLGLLAFMFLTTIALILVTSWPETFKESNLTTSQIEANIVLAEEAGL
jgi:hypothetical protein